MEQHNIYLATHRHTKEAGDAEAVCLLCDKPLFLSPEGNGGIMTFQEEVGLKIGDHPKIKETKIMAMECIEALYHQLQDGINAYLDSRKDDTKHEN